MLAWMHGQSFGHQSLKSDSLKSTSAMAKTISRIAESLAKVLRACNCHYFTGKRVLPFFDVQSWEI
jgi:hypothetical protein